MGLSFDAESLLDYWTELSVNIESFLEHWTGLHAEFEVTRERYVKFDYDLVDIANYWFGNIVTVAGKVLRYVRTTTDIEELYWYEMWLGADSKVEDYRAVWVGIREGVEGWAESYSLSVLTAQNVSDRYGYIRKNVEGFANRYGRVFTRLEGWTERYARDVVNIEGFRSNYCRGSFSIETFSNRYCNVKMFVKPSMYVSPPFGEYDRRVRVRVQAELTPMSVRYSFGDNWGEYSGDIEIYRDKNLEVVADYGDYTVRRVGRYIIRDLEGKKLYEDERDVIFIVDEDWLWKKY